MRNKIMQNNTESKSISGLLDNLRELIATGRQKALRAVDVVQVHTCWESWDGILLSLNRVALTGRNMASGYFRAWQKC